MKVELVWVQTLELLMPVQRFSILIKRRKGERLMTLDWNPSPANWISRRTNTTIDGNSPHDLR